MKPQPPQFKYDIANSRGNLYRQNSILLNETSLHKHLSPDLRIVLLIFSIFLSDVECVKSFSGN